MEYAVDMAKDYEISVKDILNLQRGDVVKYPGDNYLVVDHVDEKEVVIRGQIAGPIGVNAIPIDDLVKKAEAIAKWEDKKII